LDPRGASTLEKRRSQKNEGLYEGGK